ncbi:DNA replication/repair protein RecF [Paeniglutamicibacter psychrophenolicus]|uniref:DNA replication/repair protein RecF n=1 Tax=Paeniglutamicibacter psychrophenolicus TaxID=257454 RepID=UPI002787F156|nr:DNA replication/repair protein RecF [Paeniglutamicibacter psychrophenolicus]MDQ0095095.1 DNA replication and repair protein RecF [Paeniglutamicibacter psychrophenolicus]
MYISHVSLTDFRSYAQADVELGPGTNVLVGSNGVGKTNIVEAIGYLATLSSHRVTNDAPLLRFGTDRALVRARVQRAKLVTTLEVEITAGKANRARINRANPVRARDILGIVRTVLFAPEDLALVKGDPSNRRRFLDELLVTLRPGEAATRGDYERVLKQRNALLKSARAGGKLSTAHESTLDVWDTHLARAGARVLRGRLEVLSLLSPYMGAAYASLADANKEAHAYYQCTVMADFDAEDSPADAPAGEDGTSRVAPAVLLDATTEELEEMFLAALLNTRDKELERGITLVGPHRDDVLLTLGSAPAKGYASHGETWSLALALRLAAYKVMGEDDPRPGAGPILILDDVFAELDATRRTRLASIVAGADQVIVTAAVASDVPEELGGTFLKVSPGVVSS